MGKGSGAKAGEPRMCGSCSGAGGKYVNRSSKTKNGVETVSVWESCRPCGGSGWVS